MKKIILFTLVLMPLMAQAKVADFNALINENQNAQKALHQEIKAKVEDNRMALQPKPETNVLVEANTGAGAINVPTDKKFMRFQKEMSQVQPSERGRQERLAHELKDEYDF